MRRTARLVLWLAVAALMAGAAPLAVAKTQPAGRAASVKKPLPTPNPRRAAARTALPATVPLPLPRPHDIDKPSPMADVAARPPDIDPEVFAACMKDLGERGGEATVLEQAELPDAEAACFIPGAVSFTRVHQKDGPDIKLDSAVTMRCTLALELASWIRDDLTAIAKAHGTGVAALTGVGGFACRTRNHQSDAPISEHASGNAFDVQSVKFTDGKVVELTKFDAETKDIRAEIQKSACARFRTVLGPGADASHDNHVHLDMRMRKADFRICQWNLD